MKRFALFLAVCIASRVPSMAADHAAKETVRLEFKILTLPSDAALELSGSTVLSEESLRKVESSLKAETAKVEAYLVTYAGKDGEISTHTHLEERYPEDADRPGPPESGTIPAISIHAEPVYIAPRETGYRLTGEAKVSAPNKIEVRCQCHVTKLRGWSHETFDITEGGLRIVRALPEFDHCWITAQLLAVDRQWTLVGVASDKETPNHTLVYLIRPTIRPGTSKP